MRLKLACGVVLLLQLLCVVVPAGAQNSTKKMVFAHFMVGNVSYPPFFFFSRERVLKQNKPRIVIVINISRYLSQILSNSQLAYPTGKDTIHDYVGDVVRAHSYGIDGFALNMGSLPEDEAHNDYLLRADKIYQAAKQSHTGFKLFISVDTSSLVNTTLIQHVVTRYASHPNQLFYDGRQFLSTFLGQSAPFDWQADVLQPLKNAGHPVYFIPNFVVRHLSFFGAGLNFVLTMTINIKCSIG